MYRTQIFQELGKKITNLLYTGGFDAVIKQQNIENKWFTENNCRFALKAIAQMLNIDSCAAFFQKYQLFFQETQNLQQIAVISAGNIPCAAFHDFFCILASGNRYIGKLSKQDALLLPFIAKILINIAPEYAKKISFVEKLPTFDKIIATGNNNSTRYFAYYFKEKPLLLRKNRNSIAVLTGNETDEDMNMLTTDIFQYFGLGCRSVSKLYVPKHYNFNSFIKSCHTVALPLLNHNGYANNYNYYRTIYAMNRVPYYDGGSFLISKNEALASPISVIYYEEYENTYEVLTKLKLHTSEIQCIVSNNVAIENKISFGKTQYPSLLDYPDKGDIMVFVKK